MTEKQESSQIPLSLYWINADEQWTHLDRHTERHTHWLKKYKAAARVLLHIFYTITNTFLQILNICISQWLIDFWVHIPLEPAIIRIWLTNVFVLSIKLLSIIKREHRNYEFKHSKAATDTLLWIPGLAMWFQSCEDPEGQRVRVAAAKALIFHPQPMTRVFRFRFVKSVITALCFRHIAFQVTSCDFIWVVF